MIMKKITKIFSVVFIWGFVFAQNVFGQETMGGVTTLENPLKDIQTLDQFISKGANIVFTIAVPVLALFFIWSGFKFVSAQGDTKKIEGARETFFNTVIGAAVLLGAWVIAEAVQKTIVNLG